MKNYMKKNEDAVSPVLGVILMVAITVIIAAVVAAFVFGIGAPAKAPQVQLKYAATYNPSSFRISNDGGDALVLKNEKITVADALGATAYYSGSLLDGTDVFKISNSGPGTIAPGYLSAGQYIEDTAVALPAAGTVLTVQVQDITSGQLISKAQVTVS